MLDFMGSRRQSGLPSLSAGLPRLAAGGVHGAGRPHHEAEALSDAAHVCDGVSGLLEAGEAVVAWALWLGGGWVTALVTEGPRNSVGLPEFFKGLPSKSFPGLCELFLSNIFKSPQKLLRADHFLFF